MLISKEYFMSDYAIGIDIGGTNTKFGVVDRNGHIIMQDRTSTNEHETVQEFIEVLYAKMKPMIDKAGGPDKFVGVGVGGGTACCVSVCACRHGRVHPFICRSGWCEGQSPNSKLVEFICGATRV